MLATKCPSAEQLSAFQAGKLARAEFEQIASHLDTCTSCQTALENDSNVADDLLEKLKTAPTDDGYSDESGCHRVIPKIEAIANGTTTHTREHTAEHAPPLALPATLGKYQPLEVIGEGGMGTVYKAVHSLLKRTVALKVLPPNRLKNPQAISRFKREIEAAGRLDHRHIVRTYDADEADGQHVLAMEWLDGRDLAKLVREQGALPVEQACEFIRQAALGLECAHENGLVHRDVKPSNLLVTTGENDEEIVKVLDMGLALLHDYVNVESQVASTVKAGSGLTSDGQVMGTYDFIAPEQAMESHTVDARADIYSLGCTFYFLLTGRPPFQAKSEAQKLLAHQQESPTPVSDYRTDVRADVVAVLTKMMAKDPAQRYRSMREVVDALERLKKPKMISKRPRRRWLLVAAVALVMAPLLLGYFYGASVTRIVTNKGILVVEADDKSIEVKIKGQQVTIVDAKSKREYWLTAGEDHEVEVREFPNGVAVATKKFRLMRNGEEAVNARVEIAKVPSPQPIAVPEHVKDLVPILSPFPERITAAYSVAFHPHGSLVAAGYDDGVIRMWDATNGKLLSTFTGPGSMRSLAFSPNGKMLAVGGGFRTNKLLNNLIIWDVANGKEVAAVNVGNMYVGALAFSPDSKTLAVSSADRAEKDQPSDIRLWDVTSRKFLPSVLKEQHSNLPRSLSFSSDGKLLASNGGWNFNVRIWDVAAAKEMKVLTFGGTPVFSVAFSPRPDVQTLAVGTNDGVVHLINPTTGAELDRWRAQQNPDIMDAAYTPDGAAIVTVTYTGSIMLWELPSKKKLGEWRRPATIQRSAISGDGRHVALSNDKDGNVYIVPLELQAKK